MSDAVIKKVNLGYAAKIRILLVLVFIISTQSNIKRCIEEVSSYRKNYTKQDEVTQYDSMAHRLRSMLPPHSVVGYFSDNEFDAKKFNMLRYSILPVILVQGMDHNPILAEITNIEKHIELSQTTPFTIIESYEGNLYLLDKNY